MSTLGLPAIGGTWVQSRVAFAADHLVAVVFLGQDSQRWFNDTTSETEHQVKGGLLLDIVVGQCTSILQLFTGENQTLLVWWDALLVLDFGFDILDRVRGLDLKSDGLASQRFHENLHCGVF